MACDTRLKANQTITQRAEEIRRKAVEFSNGVANGRIKVRVGPQGAIVFDIPAEERDGISDACVFRRLMATGSALARAKIAQAEQIAGRSVNKQVVGQGVHSHDGGNTWHSGH